MVSYNHCGRGRPVPQPTWPSDAVTLTNAIGALWPAAPAEPDEKQNIRVTGNPTKNTSTRSMTEILRRHKEMICVIPGSHKEKSGSPRQRRALGWKGFLPP